MASRRRLDAWLVAEAVTSTGLLAVALLNSVRLYRGFGTTSLDVAVYMALAGFFELGKASFTAAAVRYAGRLRMAFALGACVFSVFSLAGSGVALLRDASSEAQSASVVDLASSSAQAELARLPAAIAAVEARQAAYSPSYRDYTKFMADSDAEIARLRGRGDTLRASLTLRATASVGPSRDPFGVIVAAFVPDTARRQALAATLRFAFLLGMAMTIEYGGLFMLVVALTHGKKAERVRYVATQSQAHVVASVAPDGRAITACGRAFNAPILGAIGHGDTLCVACNNTRSMA